MRPTCPMTSSKDRRRLQSLFSAGLSRSEADPRAADIFGLASEGFPSDKYLVLCGWDGDFLTTFRGMEPITAGSVAAPAGRIAYGGGISRCHGSRGRVVRPGAAMATSELPQVDRDRLVPRNVRHVRSARGGRPPTLVRIPQMRRSVLRLPASPKAVSRSLSVLAYML